MTLSKNKNRKGSVTNDLTTGSVTGTLLRFAIPFFFSSAMQALYGAVDLFVVGRFTGTSAVSAVSIGSQLMMVFTSLILGLTVGVTVTVGRSIGEGNRENAAYAIGNAITVFACIAVILIPFILIMRNTILGILKTPAESYAEAKQYVTICAFGIPFICTYNVGSSVFRGLGNSKMPLMFISIACAVNIVGDIIFVRFMNMGAAGAATATVLAQGVSSVSQIIFFKVKGLGFPFGKLFLKLKTNTVKFIFKVGAPIAVQEVLIGFAFMALTTVANARGVIASASVGVVEKLMIFLFLVPTAISSSMSAITSQNIGAGKPERANKTVIIGMIIAFSFGAAVCLLSQIIPNALCSVYAKDPLVIESAAQYLRSYSIDCALVGITFCINGYLSGSDRSMIVFIHNVTAIFLVRIPAAYILSASNANSLTPMGFSSPLGSLCSIVIIVIYLKINHKRHPSKLI